jgi:hypothetical protein
MRKRLMSMFAPACVEERPVVGVRRSARLQADSSERASRHMAQLLQEQTEQEAGL